MWKYNILMWTKIYLFILVEQFNRNYALKIITINRYHSMLSGHGYLLLLELALVLVFFKRLLFQVGHIAALLMFYILTLSV